MSTLYASRDVNSGPSAPPSVLPEPTSGQQTKADGANSGKHEHDLDLIMVVTNETMEDDREPSEVAASKPSSTAPDVKCEGDEKREPKTPKASNCDGEQRQSEAKSSGEGDGMVGGEKANGVTNDGSGRPDQDGKNSDKPEEAKSLADKSAQESTAASAASEDKTNNTSAAPPAPYQHPYHYHHNNGYPQYPHHPSSQWNQWNRHPHPPQAQHPQGYHPYYSRYPGYHGYSGQHPQSQHQPQNGHHPQPHRAHSAQQHPAPAPNASQKHPPVTTSKDDKDEPKPADSIPPSNSWNSQQHQYSHPYPHWRGQYPYNYNYYGGWRNVHWSGSAASVSTADATKQTKNKGEKKRGRDVREARDETNERELGRSYTDDTASTLSIGGLSMASLDQTQVSSPKRRKGMFRNQNIHRDLATDTPKDFPRLDATSTLSDGKMILQNLSITSIGSLRQSYSAEIAELCGPSPITVDKKHKNHRDDKIDQGKTPKKRNTSSKKAKDAHVFRLDNAPSTTPAAMRLASQDDDSPSMLDLIGTETPLLLSNMENVILDDSLTKQLRGQAFTPLPHILGGDDVWSFNGSPLGSSFEKLTPRFGLDSTKSKRNPLASPKSFWKDDFLEEHNQKKSSKKDKEKQEGVQSILSMLSPAMREMGSTDPAVDGGPTSPIPIHRKIKEEGFKSSIEHCIATPLRRPPPHATSASQQHPHRSHHNASPWRTDQRGPQPAIMHSPIPPHHSHHHSHHASPYYGEHRRDHHPYGMYPPPHHGHYNPDDRIRNLRGRCPPVHHHMPPPHHLPPPSYHHFSPLTNVPRGRGWHENQHNHLDSAGTSSSKRKCVPLRPPVPAKFQGDIEKFKDAPVPEFNNLVNFPVHMNQKQSPNVPEGMRCCVMCGQACPCSQGGKQKKGDKSTLIPLGNNKSISNTSNGFAIIPTQNKGLCTLCDVNVWIVTQTGLEIKWCKGCKNFRPWAAFGDKGLATKCVRCRDRQREKYALQKEEKERQKGTSKNTAPSVPMSMGHGL